VKSVAGNDPLIVAPAGDAGLPDPDGSGARSAGACRIGAGSPWSQNSLPWLRDHPLPGNVHVSRLLHGRCENCIINDLMAVRFSLPSDMRHERCSGSLGYKRPVIAPVPSVYGITLKRESTVSR